MSKKAKSNDFWSNYGQKHIMTKIKEFKNAYKPR